MSIIIEGPDGAGKTTLLNDLLGLFPKMKSHERFCTSKAGPIDNLSEEVFKDLQRMNSLKHTIYDRHPCISEYVYRTALSQPIDPSFLSPVMKTIRQRIAGTCFIIWCLPPLEQVKANVSLSEDMPGVAENIEAIYQQYQVQRVMWPGEYINYDYTKPQSINRLLDCLGRSEGILWETTPKEADSK
jgi:hypothetical protein